MSYETVGCNYPFRSCIYVSSITAKMIELGEPFYQTLRPIGRKLTWSYL